MKIVIGNTKQVVTLQSSQYKAAGGEGSIYVNAGMAYKIYHDPTKKQFPLNKLKELSLINDTQVVIPQQLIYDTSGNSIGYTTKYIDNKDNSIEPILKLFTKTFKDSKSIDNKIISKLVVDIQKTVNNVHMANCLIVDLNELNILVDIQSSNIVPWFIDTDSYATPSYKATAIMDSVRDRKATTYDKSGNMHYNPSIESDWFSWAILTFYLYTNIHPYRGSHSNYKPKDKQKQMDDGISVFHPNVKVPPSVNNFNVIPTRHLDWYKQVFLKNERGVPPYPDSIVPTLIPTKIVTIKSTDKLNIIDIESYDSSIQSIINLGGVYYVATKKHVYINNKIISDINCKDIKLCSSNKGTLILAEKSFNGEITFKSTTSNDLLGKVTGNSNMFSRNNSIYTISYGKLIENSFIEVGNKIICKVSAVANISNSSSTLFDGCIIQDLWGKIHLTFPYKQGYCFTKQIPELHNYRIVDAKADKNIVIIVGEKHGKYDRFVFIYKKDFSEYSFKKYEDITYDNINFAVLDNGICALLNNENELELFASINHNEILQNPPIDNSMKLFSMDDGFFFINDNSIHQLKRK